jgi:hypothetical protein
MFKKATGAGLGFLLGSVFSWFVRGTVESWFFGEVLKMIEPYPSWSWLIEYGPPALLGAIALVLIWKGVRQPEVHYNGDTLKAHVTLGPITVSVMDWKASPDFVRGISALRNEHTNVNITYYDQRHHNFAQRLSAAFEAAGWEVNFNRTAQSPWNPHHFSGIEIYGHSRYFVETIFSLMNELRGIRIRIEDNKIPRTNPKYQYVANSVYITIGFEE